ncbi:MAG TPA: hypothetical protein VFS96_08640 [Nitrolancea sp.]|nr:hypothetical protein [Nitrolancea sp.]
MPSGRWSPIAARVAPVLLLIAAAISAWYLVYDMIVLRDVGSNPNFFAGERLIAYAVFILAPALTFLPIGRGLRIPFYDLEAVTAWSTLFFTIAFISPGRNPSPLALLLFSVTLTMSLATIFTLVSYAVGFRLLTRRSQRYDFVRARREGYLVAIFAVGCALLAALSILTAVNVAVLALIVITLEILLLSWVDWPARRSVNS